MLDSLAKLVYKMILAFQTHSIILPGHKVPRSDEMCIVMYVMLKTQNMLVVTFYPQYVVMAYANLNISSHEIFHT